MVAVTGVNNEYEQAVTLDMFMNQQNPVLRMDERYKDPSVAIPEEAFRAMFERLDHDNDGLLRFEDAFHAVHEDKIHY